MSDASSAQERVLILAPTGGDAPLACEVLARPGILAESAGNLAELCSKMKEGVGVILIAEEAITPDNVSLLQQSLTEQEPWSDVPIILMTTSKEKIFAGEDMLNLFSPAGNVSLLERPFHFVTLISSVRAALRARRRQYQVRDLLMEQQSALNQRDEFLSVASHELRTPLTTLKLQTQLRQFAVQRGDSSVYTKTEVDALLQMTERQANRLARLVDDMLDISRIVNGKLALNTGFVELGKLVKDVIENSVPSWTNSLDLFTVEVPHSVSGIWDRYRIEQVVTNLVTNALKYGEGKPVQVRVKKTETNAVLEVEDQGMGIAPENLERIFQRFERASEGTQISGLGLGLYITREIVELHRGRVYVRSELGKGSTFVVELPSAA
jgi:signal transduction histidine kinase